MKRRFILPAMLIFFLSSCAYHFVGSYSSMPNGVSNVYVENIENLTSEPNLQIYLRSDLINELDLDSRVNVVSKNKADGYVYVKITSYDISPSAFSASGLTSMYRCLIGVTVSFKDKKGYIIKDKSLSSYRNYNAKDDVAATEEARNVVAKEVLSDLATKIKDELFVNF